MISHGSITWQWRMRGVTDNADNGSVIKYATCSREEVTLRLPATNWALIAIKISKWPRNRSSALNLLFYTQCGSLANYGFNLLVIILPIPSKFLRNS